MEKKMKAHPIKITLMFLLALWLPLSSVAALPGNTLTLPVAEISETVYWRGSVTVQELYNEQAMLPVIVGPNYPVFELNRRIKTVVTRKIIANGDGTATESIRYSYRQDQEVLCTYDGHNPFKYLFQMTGTGVYNSEPKPFDVYISPSNVSVPWYQGGVTINWWHNGECGGEDVYQVSVMAGQHYPDPLTPEHGDFPPGSTEIYGYVDGQSYYGTTWSDNTVGFRNKSKVTVYNLTGTILEESYLSEDAQNAARNGAAAAGTVAVGLGVAALVCATSAGIACGPALVWALGLGAAAFEVESIGLGYLADDPADPNYTEIILPDTPTTSRQPFLPGEGLTQEQAHAFNELITNVEQGIGLAPAILTSLERATGAQAANDTYWTAQQLNAARRYAGQLALLMEARPALLEDLKQALLAVPGTPFTFTGEHLAQYKFNLITQGLPPDQQQMLVELGVDDRTKAQVLHNLILTEPSPLEPVAQGAEIEQFYTPVTSTDFPADPISEFPGFLTNPQITASFLVLAEALKDFSQQKAPGTEIYLPIIVR
jgi:hypothetical protein